MSQVPVRKTTARMPQLIKPESKSYRTVVAPKVGRAAHQHSTNPCNYQGGLEAELTSGIDDDTLSRFAFPIALFLRRPLFGNPKRDPILDSPPHVRPLAKSTRIPVTS